MSKDSEEDTDAKPLTIAPHEPTLKELKSHLEYYEEKLEQSDKYSDGAIPASSPVYDQYKAIINEMTRRKSERREARMVELTEDIFTLTYIIFGFTSINVLLVVADKLPYFEIAPNSMSQYIFIGLLLLVGVYIIGKISHSYYSRNWSND